MIIDMHVHCFPDRLAPRVIPVLARKADIPAYTDGTVGQLKVSMARAGVDKSVLQPIATKPEQTQGINRWAVGVQDDQIVSFGSIHPDFLGYADEIKKLTAAGVKGIKFHPYYQEFDIDDERLFPLYDALVESGLILLFHAGEDPGYPPLGRCMPGQFKEIAGLFPKAKIVAAHMGGYRHWAEALEMLAGSGVYIDTSFSCDGLGTDGMKRMIRAYGTESVLFATDSPWGDQKREVENIRRLGLSEAETQAILGGNAVRLLGLPS